MVYLILICFAVPLLLLMTLLDRRSRLLVGFMLLGMLVAVSSYEINSTAQFLLGMSGREISVKVAPVVEELLKALPVLFYAALVCDDRRQLLPLGMSVGIGFALLENAYLLITYAEQVTLGWAVIRGISTSLSHGLCTLAVGYGMQFLRRQKKLFYTGIFGLLSLAMTYHATLPAHSVGTRLARHAAAHHHLRRLPPPHAEKGAQSMRIPPADEAGGVFFISWRTSS